MEGHTKINRREMHENENRFVMTFEVTCDTTRERNQCLVSEQNEGHTRRLGEEINFVHTILRGHVTRVTLFPSISVSSKSFCQKHTSKSLKPTVSSFPHVRCFPGYNC